MISKNNDYLEKLLNKFERKNAKIGIVGLGYVGLPLALAFCNSGFKVLGVDIDNLKVKKINSGSSYIKHISEAEIQKWVEAKKLSATSDFEDTSNCDAIILCIPTPLGKNREPNLTFIKETIQFLLPHLNKGKVISLESTTYPGTTEEIIKPLIESKGFEIGKDIFLIYSPEREDPGNIEFPLSDIPKVLGGTSKNCSIIGEVLYKTIVKQIIVVKNTKTAEMTKLIENIHRSVNIGLVNELKPLAEKMGIDLYEVIEAASTKPFGFSAYYPGPGLGGHCLPIDPFYLTWKAREFGMNTRFIELAGEINQSMPKYVVQKTIDVLNDSFLSVRGSKVLLLGMAYKKNIDDLRESPSIEIFNLLHEKGAEIEYCDPYLNEIPIMRKKSPRLKSIDLSLKKLKSFDIVLLLTDHDIFDYEFILENSKIIIDTRGRYESKGKIYRA